MSINLEIIYKDKQKDDEYLPIISTGSRSRYTQIWQPIITQHNLEWISKVRSVGLSLLEHLPEIAKIRNEFQVLYDTVAKDEAFSGNKNVALERIEIILEILDEIIADHTRYSEVYLG